MNVFTVRDAEEIQLVTCIFSEVIGHVADDPELGMTDITSIASELKDHQKCEYGDYIIEVWEV